MDAGLQGDNATPDNRQLQTKASDELITKGAGDKSSAPSRAAAVVPRLWAQL